MNSETALLYAFQIQILPIFRIYSSMKRGVNGLILCIQFLLSFICTSVREQQCCIGNIWPTFVTIVLASNCSNFDSCCLTTSSNLQWILWLQIFFEIKFDKVVFMISCTRWSINTILEFCLITNYNWPILYQKNLLNYLIMNSYLLACIKSPPFAFLILRWIWSRR